MRFDTCFLLDSYQPWIAVFLRFLHRILRGRKWKWWWIVFLQSLLMKQWTMLLWNWFVLPSAFVDSLLVFLIFVSALFLMDASSFISWINASAFLMYSTLMLFRLGVLFLQVKVHSMHPPQGNHVSTTTWLLKKKGLNRTKLEINRGTLNTTLDTFGILFSIKRCDTFPVIIDFIALHRWLRWLEVSLCFCSTFALFLALEWFLLAERSVVSFFLSLGWWWTAETWYFLFSGLVKVFVNGSANPNPCKVSRLGSFLFIHFSMSSDLVLHVFV